jgi:hypothetical protein
LTPDGWGGAKIGMTRAQVERALHVRLKGEAIDDEKTCIEMTPTGPDRGIWFTFEDYKLTRVSISSPSKVRTRRGIGIGASAAQVRQAYGRALKAENHHYEDLPAEYLTYWTVRGKRGIRFETSGNRRVQTIHAGTSSIELVEGCA